METTYKIVRMFMNHPSVVVERGVTLEEAKEHCSDPQSSSKTCTTEEGMALTAEKGPWFDGFDEE